MIKKSFFFFFLYIHYIMNKYKFLMLIGMIITIFSISQVYAKENDKTLLGISIYLDPGHGGIDSGTTYKNIYEKDINLILCKKLQEKLIANGATVYLTRNTDKDLSSSKNNRKRSDLLNRAYLINKTKPNMYISIHVNYLSNTKYKGLQIFYNDKNKENQEMAKLLTKYLKEKTWNIRESKFNDTYYMYKNIASPGILIEVGFISNPDDRYRLTHEEYQDILIENITYSIIKYFKEK